MPTLTELLDSREWTTGEKPTVVLHYQLAGVADDATVKSLLESSTPATHGGLDRDRITFEPVWVDTEAGDGLWDARVHYAASDDREPQTGDSSFSFDTGGGTQHITQSIETIDTHVPAGAEVPDFKGAIGVTHDSVEGVDITAPVYNFSETHYLADATVTTAYKGTLFGLTGKVNDASFKGLAAGECLFLGASGAKRGADDWEITFRFAASPNKTGITVGDITGIDKKGWEYLWVQYEDRKDPNAKVFVKHPVAACVEKVYEEGDFSDLGIGT